MIYIMELYIDTSFTHNIKNIYLYMITKIVTKSKSFKLTKMMYIYEFQNKCIILMVYASFRLFFHFYT